MAGHEAIVIPRFDDLLVLGDRYQPTKWEWEEWANAKAEGRPSILIDDAINEIERTLRFRGRVANTEVPIWRQRIIGLIGDLDDIEDQLSTVLWLSSFVLKKVPYVGPKLAHKFAKEANFALDDFERLLATGGITRSAKSKYTRMRKARTRRRRGKRRGLMRGIAWLQNNQGQLLEAAQATGTWFDYGIILGPIMGVIEESVWGIAKWAAKGYGEIIDLFLPGYSEDFARNAAELDRSVSRGWDITWEFTKAAFRGELYANTGWMDGLTPERTARLAEEEAVGRVLRRQNQQRRQLPLDLAKRGVVLSEADLKFVWDERADRERARMARLGKLRDIERLFAAGGIILRPGAANAWADLGFSPREAWEAQMPFDVIEKGAPYNSAWELPGDNMADSETVDEWNAWGWDLVS